MLNFPNIYNLQNPGNVVSYSETRLNPQAVNHIIKQGKQEGLSNSKALNENLKSSQYIPVLNAIWSERDKNRRLEWLRSHESEMHAPLMFEQAITEFVIKPTVETIIQISIPLIKAASFRVVQDSKCSTDPSVFNGDAAQRMEMTYLTSLNTQTEIHINKKLVTIISENEDAIKSAVNAKVLKIAHSSITQDLPSPNWIGHHGLSVFRSGNIEMHSTADFKNHRDKVANDTIKKLNTKQG